MDITDIIGLQDTRGSILPRVPKEAKELQRVADDFESLFVKTMLDSMRNTLNKESRIIDGGFSEEVFEDMLYDKYAQLFAKVASFGISEAIVQQLSRPTL